MKNSIVQPLLLSLLLASLAACGGGENGSAPNGGSAPAAGGAAQPAARSSAPVVSQAAPGAKIAHDLKPLPGKESTAPAITKKTVIRFETTAGELAIEVYPDAAPNAAKRFVELVQRHWVRPGGAAATRSPGLHHNVSNTCTVRPDEWDDVADFI